MATAQLWFCDYPVLFLGLDEFGSRGDVMGGLQDNGTLVANKPFDQSSWHLLLTGDGGYSAITKNELFHFAYFNLEDISVHSG